jgi:hypothetical protein
VSARCPEGHLSESLDYCDVCGAPMGAAAPDAGGSGGEAVGGAAVGGAASGPGLPEPSQTPSAATQTCPHCGAANVPDALFCEACGYDFTTGTPPMGSDPEPSAEEVEPESEDEPEESDDESPPDAADDEPPAAATETDDDAATEDHGAAAEEDPADEQPDPVDHAAPSAPLTSGESSSEATEQGHSPTPPDAEGSADDADEAQDPTPDPQPRSPQPAMTAHRKARHTPPSRALAESWVVELWVDPDWYAVQQTAEACPSAGVPDIVLLTRSAALIGRPSGSLGVRPEIDAGADSAVSRRHAQLTSDGQRWWVEDLESSNGTFVGTVGEPVPTEPIPPGQRVEIDRDDRLYVGAWTRVVLRQATASERQGTG